MARFALWPFGRTVIERPPRSGAMSAVANVIWFVVAGLWLAIGHITTAAAQAVTIVGIPLALANLKMIPVTCFPPFGKEIVDSDRVPPPAATSCSPSESDPATHPDKSLIEARGSMGGAVCGSPPHLPVLWRCLFRPERVERSACGPSCR